MIVFFSVRFLLFVVVGWFFGFGGFVGRAVYRSELLVFFRVFSALPSLCLYSFRLTFFVSFRFSCACLVSCASTLSFVRLSLAHLSVPFVH